MVKVASLGHMDTWDYWRDSLVCSHLHISENQQEKHSLLRRMEHTLIITFNIVAFSQITEESFKSVIKL